MQLHPLITTASISGILFNTPTEMYPLQSTY